MHLCTSDRIGLAILSNSPIIVEIKTFFFFVTSNIQSIQLSTIRLCEIRVTKHGVM